MKSLIPPMMSNPPPKADTDKELALLKELLFKQELEMLNSLVDRINNPERHVKDISKVIAEAIAMRANTDDQLRIVLQPTIEKVLDASVKNNPTELAKTIFPLMGPAIRKSIAEGFRGMLEGFNKSIEMAVSWRALRWRIEAMRTGKPYKEVVLLHTLVYQVEQVFLIHSHTGLMLGHATAEGVEYQDADLVSGMLTAIQDFVKSCFSIEGSTLDTMQMGEKSLIVETGAQASIALVVRGTLPVGFRNKIRDVLDIIHALGAKNFASFNGEMEQFRSLHYLLEDCLDKQLVEEEKKLPIWVKTLPVVIIMAAILTPTYIWFTNKTFYKVLDKLAKYPGIVVNSSSGNRIFGWQLNIVRDPLSEDPATIIANEQFNLKNVTIHETLFASVSPAIVELRLKEIIDLPTVKASLKGGTLTLTGTAPIDWVLMTTDKALSVPGVDRVDTVNLVDERSDILAEMIRKVQNARIEFPIGKASPEGENMDSLVSAVDTLKDIAKLATEMGLSTTLIIYGHTDTTGTDLRNYNLSEARAKTFASMLYSKGVSMPIQTYGFGSEYALDYNTEDQNRRIELKVHLSYLGKSLVTLDDL